MANSVQYGDLASGINDFMTGQAQKPYLQNLPNYYQNIAQAGNNTSQQLKGQLPDDVINQIAQQAAERGVANGSPLSPNSKAAYLKALGLNSLQMMQQGQQNFHQQIEDTPVPQLFNPASLIVPNMNANNEMVAALRGRQTGAPGRGPISPPLAPGAFNSGSFTNGMWNGNQGGGPLSVSGPSWGAGGETPTTPGAMAGNWWDTYGGKSPSYNPFAEEDAYFNSGANLSDYDWFD